MPLAQLLAGFQSLSPLTTSTLGPSGADSLVGGFVYILGPCGPLQWALVWLGVSPTAATPTDFSQSEILRLYFPALDPWVAWSVSLPSCSSWFICTQMWDYLPCQLLPFHESSLPQLSVSTPPANLDECFFFNSLVVGLPDSLIFWQFWLCFVFKYVVVLLLVVWGGTVCLPTPPSWAEVGFFTPPTIWVPSFLPTPLSEFFFFY